MNQYYELLRYLIPPAKYWFHRVVREMMMMMIMSTELTTEPCISRCFGSLLEGSNSPVRELLPA
jgi:hypothetical protein